jgi:endonuclease YncB( thermonuclease family)
VRGLLLLLMAIAGPAWGSSCRTMRADVTTTAEVRTGDTLAGGYRWSIRIAGISVPERTEARSRAALAEILRHADHRVRILPIMHLDCGVSVLANVYVGDESIAAIMLRDGMAVAFVQQLPLHVGLQRKYLETERRAREQRTGLWPVWLGP